MTLLSRKHPAVSGLVFANVAIFLAGGLLSRTDQRWLTTTFGLSRTGLEEGRIWQLITHQFLHGGLFHLAVNMAGLWFAGRILESLLGARRFLLLYLFCGVCGGLLQMALSPHIVLIGASGAVLGIVCAYAALFPEQRITALVFFVLPVNLQAKWLGWGIVVISALMTLLTGPAGSIGHAAHLGGAVAGYCSVWLSRKK